MIRFLVVSLLVFTAHIPTSLAQWSPTARTTFTAMNKKYASLDQMGLATFWGGFKRRVRLTWNRGDTISWKTPLFKQGELPLYYSEQDDKAPLVVFMPGVFGTTDGGLTPYMIQRFERLGAHVLVVPNLVSVQYVHAYPLYGGDIVENEARVMESALEFALSKLKDKVSGVHVVAESLGAMVGSAWVAWDSGHLKRVTSMTLLNPPLDLAQALTNFDDVIEEYRPSLESCSTISLAWKVLTDFILSDLPREMPLETKRCLAARVLINAFLEAAQKSYLAHAVALTDKSAYQVESFDGFFRRYRPQLWALLESKDERLRLDKWVALIHQQSDIPIRILTSRDDFLNRGQSWASFLEKTKLPNEDLVILNFGGHSGALACPELDGVLAETIGPASKT